MRYRSVVLFAVSLALAGAAFGSAYPHRSSDEVAVVIDGIPRPEYQHGDRIYVEALRGENYSIRLSNPWPYRVAVALSVDGLNTIDAQHIDAWSASKWVLDPYETAEISGWQVSDRTARRFVFTGETRSYAAALGDPDNLGVIEAVFYRERERVSRYHSAPPPRSEAPERESAGAPAPSSSTHAQKSEGLSDDYAGTGMGRRKRHHVAQVDIDLDPTPIASVRIRYEFRPQLVKLGVLPRATRSPLERRERARGFDGYCPEID